MITIEEILSRLSPREIMERYFPESITTKKVYRNPYRIDKSPGCTFKEHPKKGLIFIDWSKAKTYDCFEICKEQNNLKNFKEIMSQIDTDFNLNISPKNFKIKPPDRKIENKIICLPQVTESNPKAFDLRTLTKPWDTQNLLYWDTYGIKKDVLDLFKVSPCVRATLNGKLWLATKDNPIYQYSEPFGIQLYRPLAKKENGRFTQNLPPGYLMGIEQLPKEGKILFITKSRKDVMVLFQLGIPAVAPIGESGFVNPDIINNLKKRFQKIVILFDNDESGINGALKLVNLYQFSMFRIPDTYDVKDIAEFVKVRGYLDAARLLKLYGAKNFFG